jgi:hypothetical protein
MKPSRADLEDREAPPRRTTGSACQWGVNELQSKEAIESTDDPYTLARMADDLLKETVPPSEQVVSALSENQMLPLDDAYQLAKKFPDAAINFCMRPDTTSEMLDEFADQPRCFAVLTCMEHTSRQTLERIAKAISTAPAGRVLVFARISVTALEGYVANDDWRVREIVAMRGCSGSVLQKLSVDPVSKVRAAVVANPNTRLSLVKTVAINDEDAEVLTSAAARLCDPAVLNALAERLADIPDERLRKAILQNPHSSEYAKTIATLVSQKPSAN